MKTSTILLALLSIASAELVVRQDANTTTTPAATITSVDTSPQATCLAACNPADVNCRAAVSPDPPETFSPSNLKVA
ncbi:MAG: hypothetical protein CL912_30560 [Deltaproteobacteria bacterium]|nr:hypothetical protein [Deltaproteobacteria bacterium]